MASSVRMTGGPRMLLTALLILALIYLLHKWNATEPVSFDIQVPSKRVDLHVYYEVLCPDSRHFVLNQLEPLYRKAARFVDVHLRPYGKAETKKVNSSSFDFDCQHGPTECLGNTIHACVIDLYRQEQQLEFVFCTIADDHRPLQKGQECASKQGLDWSLIESCAKGLKGQQLLASIGEETHALNPAVTFIPTITLNGDQSHQGLILKDLTKAVCNLYEDPKPRFC